MSKYKLCLSLKMPKESVELHSSIASSIIKSVKTIYETDGVKIDVEVKSSKIVNPYDTFSFDSIYDCTEEQYSYIVYGVLKVIDKYLYNDKTIRVKFTYFYVTRIVDNIIAIYNNTNKHLPVTDVAQKFITFADNLLCEVTTTMSKNIIRLSKIVSNYERE